MPSSLPGSPHRFGSPLDAFAFDHRANSAFTNITPFSALRHDEVAIAIPISKPKAVKSSCELRDICVVAATVFAVIGAVASSTAVIAGLVMVKTGEADRGEEMMVIAAPICIITDLICAYFVVKCLLYRKKEALLLGQDKDSG